MSKLQLDLKQSLVSLGRSPAFSLSVIATLVLVLGPALALFALVEQLFWRTLPLPHPEQLVVLQPPQSPFSGSSSSQSNFSIPMSYPEYRTFAKWEGGPFSGVVTRAPATFALAFDQKTDEVSGELVSGNYFSMLGVPAAAGRLFTPEDDVTPGDHPVAVLSYAAWQRRFGADPGVVGRTVRINGHPMTILGVAARDFRSLELEYAPELWLTMAEEPLVHLQRSDLDNPRSRWLNIVARLKPGVSLAAAEKLANQLYRRSSEEIAATMSNSDDFKKRFVDRHLSLVSAGHGRSDLRGSFSRAMFTVLALVGLLFALACANLANLFAGRATRHERELTLRIALGADRRDLIWRLLLDAGVLALIAVALGTVVAVQMPRLLANDLPGVLAGLSPEVSPILLAIGAALVILATLGCGLLPALTATRGEIADRLRSSSASALGGGRGTRARRTLVAVQVTLSVAVLASAGLLVRTLERLASRDPGFDTQSTLTFQVNPQLTGYTLAEETQLLDRIEEALRTLPGVRAAARGSIALLTDSDWSSSIEVEGIPTDRENRPSPRFDVVSPDYFATLDIPLRSGRGFTTGDVAGSQQVAIVNPRFVHEVLADADPIGRVVSWGREPDLKRVTIVGVVDEILSANLREEYVPRLFLPFAQRHDFGGAVFYVRTSSAPSAMLESVRRSVASIDPQLPVTELRTVADQARKSMGLERATAWLASSLGVVAALLAAVGLYGVLAYAVDSRKRELALRAALGAEPAGILRWVTVQAGTPIAIGLACGLGLALAGSRLLATLLFEITPYDPPTYLFVAVGVVAVAAAAVAVPARRALAVQPALALREE